MEPDGNVIKDETVQREDASKAPQSYWVNFMANPEFDPSRKTEYQLSGIGIDTAKRRPFYSEFIGMIKGGVSSKRVFAQNEYVEWEIGRLRSVEPVGPWCLPVYCRESEKVFNAYMVDSDQLNLERGPMITQLPPQLLDRQIFLEREVADLRRKWKELIAARLSESMLAVVDFQNIRKSLQTIYEENPSLTDVQVFIEDIIEDAREYDPPEGGRVLIRALIFDFCDPNFMLVYKRWEGSESKYKFEAVQPIPGCNPTDQVIIERTLALIDSIGIPIDRVFLFSGDGDFVPLLRKLKKRGCKVSIASFPKNTALALNMEAEQRMNLSRYFYPNYAKQTRIHHDETEAATA